jgi:LacI family transcriptional regulator
MHEAGLEVPPNWIIENTLVLEDGVAAYHQAMKAESGTEAFFCAGDFAALGIMQAARQEGRKIPEELGITGFANEPFTAYLSPSLTTVDQRGPEMGRKVAEMFLKCEMQDLDPGCCGTTTLKPELIIRESSTKKQ